ncbi:MAG: C-GCAxxG-C-C family protein [Desulfosalsimonadaceae bacterium]
MATLEVFQDMTGRPDDAFLKACTGLEGGGAASGSTCGVVSGGVLSLACTAEPDLLSGGVAAERVAMEGAAQYVRWFADNYGSCLCRDRIGIDFYTKTGQMRYLLPGDKVLRCLVHIRGAMRYLHTNRFPREPEDSDRETEPPGSEAPEPFHCARAVLEGVRQQTGIGNPRLERMAFVMDGGFAFSGGACGAMAGALMAVNLVLGLPIRQMTYRETVAGFVREHVNLLRKTPVDSLEPLAVGRKMLTDFREIAGGIECRAITGRLFSDWNTFQNYMAEAPQCQGLIEAVIRRTSEEIRSLEKRLASRPGQSRRAF